MGVAPGMGAIVGARVDGLVEGVSLVDTDDGIVGSGTNALGLDDARMGIVGSLVGNLDGKTLGSNEGITLGALVGPVARISLTVNISIISDKPIVVLRFSPTGKNSASRVATYKFNSSPRSTTTIFTFTKLQLGVEEKGLEHSSS